MRWETPLRWGVCSVMAGVALGSLINFARSHYWFWAFDAVESALVFELYRWGFRKKLLPPR